MVVPARTSSPSVRLGWTPLRKDGPLRAWSPPPSPCDSAALLARPETITNCCLKGSSGAIIWVNWKFAPSPMGVHLSSTAPWGT